MSQSQLVQHLEAASTDQLIAQPLPASKEALNELLAANNEEIAENSRRNLRLANLNKKILGLLNRPEQPDQSQDVVAEVSIEFKFLQQPWPTRGPRSSLMRPF
jgi:hypothetical protein